MLPTFQVYLSEHAYSFFNFSFLIRVTGIWQRLSKVQICPQTGYLSLFLYLQNFVLQYNFKSNQWIRVHVRSLVFKCYQWTNDRYQLDSPIMGAHSHPIFSWAIDTYDWLTSDGTKVYLRNFSFYWWNFLLPSFTWDSYPQQWDPRVRGGGPLLSPRYGLTISQLWLYILLVETLFDLTNCISIWSKYVSVYKP